MPPTTCLARRISSFPTDPKLRFLRLFAGAMLFTSHSSRLVLSFLEPSGMSGGCRFGIWQAASEGGRVATSLPGCRRSHTENLTGDLKIEILKSSPALAERGVGGGVWQEPRPFIPISGRHLAHGQPGLLEQLRRFLNPSAFFSDSSLREKLGLFASFFPLTPLRLSLFLFLPPTLTVSLALFSWETSLKS